MYIEDFYYLEFSDFSFKRTNHSSDYLIANASINYVNIWRILNDFYEIC